MERNLRKYIGRPYEKTNCFDLVKEFYQDIFGLKMDYDYGGETPDRRQVELLINSNRGDFIQVDQPKFGDLVLIKFYGLDCHIGIFVSEGVLLHSIRGAGSSLDRIAKYKHMISGYYRHREAA